MTRSRIYCYAIALFLALNLACSPEREVRVELLTVEYLQNPIGIDRTEPLLSWQQSSEENGKYQSAYQVLVATSPELLTEEAADVWNSTKVNSRENLNIRYYGNALKSGQRYYWKVRIWDEANEASDWSEVQHWQMGPLSEADWKGKWISAKYAPVSDKREPFSQYDDSRTFTSEDSAAHYLRKTFETRGHIENATIYLSGLGYYELYLNGEKVGDRVLDPVFTDYQKTVKYVAYEVTDELQAESLNAMGVILGNGFYNQTQRDLFQMEKANWKTPPKLLLQLEVTYTNGEKQMIVSDSTWQWSQGPIIYNSIRGGETIDSRINITGWNQVDYDGNGWRAVKEVPAPLGKLVYQYMPPLRQTKNFNPSAQWSPAEQVMVFDFGENITGYADLVIEGQAGEQIDIYFNEVLNADSTLNIKHSAGHTWSRFQHGKMILSGKEDHYEPRFTYHGFRYVQVVGVEPEAIKSITAHAVHTDLEPIGTFESSNDRLNQLHAAVRRTLLNSVHSMPGEEPTREKMGWAFDAGMVTMESYLYNFDAINTYKKYLQDLIDGQEPNGHVPPIVPTNGWGFLEKTAQGRDTTILYDDPWWGGTLIYVADKLFEMTGDTAIIRESYEPIKAYTDFVQSTAINDIVYWSLGDWLDLTQGQNGQWGPGLTPISLTSTAANYHFSERTAHYAKMLGYNDDAERYTEHAERIKMAFNKQFLNEASGWYAENSQTAQALPLYLGLVPEDEIENVTKRLIEAIEANQRHTSVGFIGVNPMLKYLSENGYMTLVYEMVTQEESPGWLHFVKDAKSTMGENLNAEGYGTSHHPFASNIGFWLYNYLGGITINRTQEQAIHLKPGIDTDLQWVKSSYNGLMGRIEISWKRKGGEIIYDVRIPVNERARLSLPSGYRLKDDAFEQTRDSYIIPSGTYQLIIQNID